eukprot:c16335_g1_i1 orf=522-2207(+)
MANKSKTLTTFTHSVESLHLGSKSSTSEDEVVTWLQLPLDYTLERGNCSEIFGRLSSSLGKAKLDSDQGVPVSMENGATGGASTVPDNAKDALALGARRASGYVLPEGAEAFTKVKTIMRQAPSPQSSASPCKISKDLVPPSPLQMSHEKYESANSHASIYSEGFTNTTLLSEKYPAYGVLHNFPANYLWASVSPPMATDQGMESLQLSKEAAAGSTLCGSSCFITSKDQRKSSDAETQITHTQGSSYSLITEDHMRDTSFHAASAGDWEPVCPAPYDAGTAVKLTPLLKERQWQETFGNVHVDVPDVVPSCSGGSQTSAEMSTKEISSIGKQKLEEPDCQSKNAEVDSAETSQPHRRPSKRSRVAESHNLSEKRRRTRINEKLKTLQELIPNSSKTDKASILDEAIEYLKALQSQLQMMSSRSGMRLSPMVVPPGMQHIPMAQMASVHPMGLGLPLVHAGMGMGMGLMDLTHGMDGRSFQAPPGTSPHFNVAYPGLASLRSQICSQPYPGMEVPSSEFWPVQPPSAHAYQQVYEEPQAVSSVEMHQQGEQLSTSRVSKDR